MIPIKTAAEIEIMRDVCRIAATVLDELCDVAKPGVNTYDLDLYGRDLISKHGAQSSCFNYQVGNKCYPAYTCISVNEQVVHGIGDLNCILKEGDAVTLDVCVKYNGYVGDNARTILVGGSGDPKVVELVEVTKKALEKGIKKALPNNRVGDISSTIQDYVEGHGFSVLRDFVGHGVGRSMHEEPQIPNFGKKKTGPKLRAGMTLAIEPMVNMGKHHVEYAEDGWTVLTKDRKPAAHFEHTVLITDEGPEILTFSQNNEKNA